MQTNYKCLAIDDDKLFLRKLEVYFQDIEWLDLIGTEDHPVRGATALFSMKPEILFLDMEMPHIDGHYVVDWVTPRLEQMENPPQIIVVSALYFSTDEKLPGVKGYINKGDVTSSERLAELVRAIIE